MSAVRRLMAFAALREQARRLLYKDPFARWTQRYAEWRLSRRAEAPPARDEDGLPIPSAFLITLVSGPIPWRDFLAGGRAALSDFASAVDRNGGDFARAQRILDFGCGCGRLARHARSLTAAELSGVDYNARLVDWCAANLPGRYAQNRLHPPLAFPDGHFDILYALSVFTHLRRATQDAWLDEFARVLKPGGFALVTFHDEDHPRLAEAGVRRDDLLREGFAVAQNHAEGSNFIAAFQTRAATREQFSRAFDVLELVTPERNSMVQTIAVLRRRG